MSKEFLKYIKIIAEAIFKKNALEIFKLLGEKTMDWEIFFVFVYIFF